MPPEITSPGVYPLDPVRGETDFAQRCCQCRRTDSWQHVGIYELIECACGHEVCGECSPLSICTVEVEIWDQARDLHNYRGFQLPGPGWYWGAGEGFGITTGSALYAGHNVYAGPFPTAALAYAAAVRAYEESKQ